MAEVIRMPLLSDTMKEGKIVSWLKQIGDQVASDEVIAEVQTDKATMELVPYVDGTLLYVGVKEGENAAVNQLIAIIGDEKEDIDPILTQETTNAKNGQEEEPAEKPSETSAAPEQKKIQLPPDLEIIRMPLLSDTMKEGKIISWQKSIGDQVASDDVLAEVETDKATMEVIGYAEGTLLYQGVKAGEKARVNQVIAIIGSGETDITPYLDEIRSEPENTKNITGEPVGEPEKKTSHAPEHPGVEKTFVPTAINGRVKASPLAKKLAREKGIDISNLRGSGDGGRIVKRDVETPQKLSSPSVPAEMKESFTDIPLTQMREIIAQRLGESKFNAPHFYLNVSVEIDKLLDLRKQINAKSPRKISINDMLIKAVALSLKENPKINCSWLGDKIRQNHHIHIGSAVAIDEGLIVPVIKFADIKTLEDISEEAEVLYEKARNNKLQPSEFTGNTFTISNLGMMGIDHFTAIINPPDACILAVGQGTVTPVYENGKFVPKTIMKLTLSCDHRVVDGAVGSIFLSSLKEYIQNPGWLLM